MPLTQHMHVDVMHRLATQVIAIHYHAKTVVAALLLGQALGGEEDMPSQRLVRLAQVIEGADVCFRDHQKVHRCLRSDIVKGNHLVIFIKLARRYLTSDDLAK